MILLYPQLAESNEIGSKLSPVSSFKIINQPWLVGLSGLSAGLQTKVSLVRFPVREHAWVAGQAPGGGAHERQPHTDVSLPLFLSPFPCL